MAGIGAATNQPSQAGHDETQVRADFERLVADHQDRALRLALRLLAGDRAGAEDVVQEAFVRAYRALERFRGEAQLTTWFNQIVVREAYRYLRSPWRRWFAGDAAADEPDSLPAPASMTDPWLRERVEQALGKLSAHQRTVFVLVHLEGYSVTEAAGLMDRSPGTLKSHLHRALKRLRSDLADLAPDLQSATVLAGDKDDE